jgi:1,2-diacylglycerol 3-beta-galactosyltransferase
VWVREQGVGVVLPNFRRIGRAVEEMLEPSSFARFRAATERLHNRAVFEIPDILEEILDGELRSPGQAKACPT